MCVQTSQRDCEDVLVEVSELVSEGQSTGRTHRLYLTVFGAGGPVGTAIPLYDHALN